MMSLDTRIFFPFNLHSHVYTVNIVHGDPSDTCRHSFTSSNATGIASEGKSFRSRPSLNCVFSPPHSDVSSSRGETSSSGFLTCTCCILTCEFTGLCSQAPCNTDLKGVWSKTRSKRKKELLEIKCTSRKYTLRQKHSAGLKTQC